MVNTETLNVKLINISRKMVILECGKIFGIHPKILLHRSTARRKNSCHLKNYT
jgi:hypothetical protein